MGWQRFLSYHINSTKDVCPEYRILKKTKLIHTEKMNLDMDLTLFTKINSKEITGLNVKGKTINPQMITGENLELE